MRDAPFAVAIGGLMIRNATIEDIPRLVEIRSAVRENQLRDTARVTHQDYVWFITNPGIFVWHESNDVVGFSAADPRDGNIWALFVAPDHERRGIGQALLVRACELLRDVGVTRAWLTTRSDTRAEQFYREAGWTIAGTRNGELLFEMRLDELE